MCLQNVREYLLFIAENKQVKALSNEDNPRVEQIIVHYYCRLEVSLADWDSHVCVSSSATWKANC